MKKDCIVHFHCAHGTLNRVLNGSAYDAPPLFFHQLKQRDPESFNRYLLPPIHARKHASFCVSTNKHITGSRSLGLELYTPNYDSDLVVYAEHLFNLSDIEWAKVQ